LWVGNSRFAQQTILQSERFLGYSVASLQKSSRSLLSATSQTCLNLVGGKQTTVIKFRRKWRNILLILKILSLQLVMPMIISPTYHW
jgi:hypothetical protein